MKLKIHAFTKSQKSAISTAAGVPYLPNTFSLKEIVVFSLMKPRETEWRTTQPHLAKAEQMAQSYLWLFSGLDKQ